MYDAIKTLEQFNIIGFDFGHGETALAQTTSTASRNEPQVLELYGEKSQITALAITRYQEPHALIGEEALELNDQDMQELHVGFKPILNQANPAHNDELVTLFMQVYLKNLRQQSVLQEHETPLFVVGAPSGWSAGDRQQYVRVLQDAGMTRVKVEKESRAAFLHIKESRDFHVNTHDLMKCILIIDVGSSTTDLTFVEQLEAHTLEDFGYNLGAGLIDEVILARTLERLEQEDAEERQRLEEVFEKHPFVNRRCLIASRRGKEQYFKHVGRRYLTRDHAVPGCGMKIRTVRPAIEFEPVLYAGEMEIVLNTPIPQLENRSWKSAFADILRDAAEKMPHPPTLIILTGGASRMSFIPELCQEIFTQVKVLERGPEPEFTIAKGLARIGRIDFLAQQFKETIAQLEHSDELLHLIRDKIMLLIERMTVPLVEEVLTFLLRPVLLEWRQGQMTTLAEIEPAVEHRKQTEFVELKSQDARRIVDQWFHADFLPGLTTFTDPICQTFAIPRSALDLHNKAIATGISSIHRIPVDPNVIVEHNVIEGIIVLISGVIAGMASGGAGMALLGLPLVGQIIAGTLFAELAVGGVKMLENTVKTMDLPVFLRTHILSDNRIEKILEKQRGKLLAAIQQQLLDEPTWRQHLEDDILRELKHILNTQMEEAILWIR